jgi:perosamine synthetase
MGLPLACRIASQGARVFACDVNAAVCDSINNGQCPFDEPGLDVVLKNAVVAGRLHATTDTATAVSQCSVVIVIVPVLLTETNEADTSIIRRVTEDIARGLKKGSMVSYETTLPVGTTRSFAPLLETSGLKAGEDFDLVFSPERVKSQLVMERLSENPKVVGGVNEKSAARAAEFYKKYLGAPVINVGSLEASEFVKLAGMVYRDVNIALANELARYASAVGVNIDQVIAAANTDGEATILSPGIGVGGHCTPVYPYFLMNDAARRGVSAELAGASRLINDQQPAFMIDQVEENWGLLKQQKVLILGLAFRPQVKESICSPAFLLRDELIRRGAQVYLQDPLYTADELSAYGFEAWTEKRLPPVVILNTAHNQFKQMQLNDLAKSGCQVFVDGRNIFSAEQISSSGLVYIGIGRAASASRAGTDARPHQRIPIIRPQLGNAESQAAASVISSGWIMQGPRVQELEKQFAAYAGADFACAVSSGTAALHLALLAAGVQAGDEVITVSHSFIATANSIRYCGAVPVFVDIDPGTFNIDVNQIEDSITDKTKAILCVHQMGMPCDLRAILELRMRYPNIRIIEDAACAIGSEIIGQGEWQRIGRPHADMACFSFHPRKLLTTGDGGMITTANPEFDRLCRQLRNHGLEGASYERLGYNYRLTDVQAAIGIKQLARLHTLIPNRRKKVELYKTILGQIAGVRLPEEPEWARSNWQSFCIRFDSEADRSHVARALDTHGVDSRAGIMCAHREPAYSIEPWRCGSATIETSAVASKSVLHKSEICQDTSLILPLYESLTYEEIHHICGIVKQALVPASTSREQ